MTTKNTNLSLNVPIGREIFQMNTKYTKWPLKVSIGREIDQMAKKYMYQRLPLQGPPKFIQIGVFGLKIYRLATLFRGYFSPKLIWSPC
jgi:hypothetical protein